eukprot:m.263818 g.263818  ORF g.263818 m.263818 type:complete len:51 (-) comp52464_c0_seq1:81-233(-)
MMMMMMVTTSFNIKPKYSFEFDEQDVDIGFCLVRYFMALQTKTTVFWFNF